MFRGIDHTAIASSDPEALASWYVLHFGFSILERSAARIFIAAADGSMLEFVPAVGARVQQHHKAPGLRHLAIAVEDLDAACRRLEEQGVQFFEPARVQDGVRLAFFDDPDGNILHLIERKRPSSPETRLRSDAYNKSC